jgi:hypothetical protein
MVIFRSKKTCEISTENYVLYSFRLEKDPIFRICAIRMDLRKNYGLCPSTNIMDLKNFIDFCKKFHEKNYDVNQMDAEIRNLKWKPLKDQLLKTQKIKPNTKKVLEGIPLHNYMETTSLEAVQLYNLGEKVLNNYDENCYNYTDNLRYLKNLYEDQKLLTTFKFFKSCQFGIILLNFCSSYKKALEEKKETIPLYKKIQGFGINASYARKHEILGKLAKDYPRLKLLNWSFDRFYKHRNEIIKLLDKKNVIYKDIQLYWSTDLFK